VRARGGRALVVGGWVRDQLRGQPSKDMDLEVFGVPQEELPRLLAAFGRVEAVGESFAVYKLVANPPNVSAAPRSDPAGRETRGPTLDIALPRRDSKTGRGHRGFHVQGDPSLSFEDAARRRDFTINAISFDPLTGEYIDPFDGRGDLRRRLLRAVDRTTFGDDSLRVLRALQFAARFEYALDDATASLCRTIALDDLPAERVWGEFDKLLIQAERPSIGFALALDLGVVDRLLPEVKPLVGCAQEPDWHPEGDVWTHTLLVIDKARALNADLARPHLIALMLGAVCHDLGKPATTAFIDGRIRSPDHEDAGVRPTLALLDRLNVHTIDGYDVRRQVIGLVAQHLKPGMFHKAPLVTDGAFRRLAQKVDLELLARLARADCLGRAGNFDCAAMDWFIDRARTLGVEHQPPEPLLMGRHLLELGLAPGPRIGHVLKQVYEKQLDGAITTVEEGIAEARRVISE
jgi:tRNA nucleotidyltransferase (CCA-adding enzyme)